MARALITGFDELGQQFEELAIKFERLAEKRGRDTARAAIERGVERAIEQTVVPEMKARVPEDTGRLKQSISHESRGWSGGTYHHVAGSTLPDEYARVQEFGTRKSDYVIEPRGDYPLRFRWENPPAGAGVAPGTMVRFQYVVHPGVDVPQPGPQQSALKDSVHVIQGHVGNEIQKLLEDNL